MKDKLRKRLEKAALIIREVYDEIESEDQDDFEKYGERMEDIAGELEDIVSESEGKLDDDEEEDPYWEE